MDFTCKVPRCNLKFYTSKYLLSHIKQHIKDGYSVKYPYTGCAKVYKVVSSFSAHVSRKHFASILDDKNADASNLSLGQNFEQCHETESIECDNATCNLEDHDVNVAVSLLRKHALFFMKLQFQFLIPESTVTKLIYELDNFQRETQTNCNDIMRKILIDFNIDYSTIEKIMNSYDEKLSKICGNTCLFSAYLRKLFYQNNFNCVLSVGMRLGDTMTHEPTPTFEYIPILKTLQFLFQDPAVREDYLNPVQKLSNKLRDFCDGNLFGLNDLFRNDKSSLQMILYQDSFEVANPLGSAKKKHKILAVYMTLGNIHVHYRSKVNLIQLVLMCKEKDLVSEPECQLFFAPLINDLKILENEGVDLGFE